VSVLPILRWPDRRLSEACAPVDCVDGEVRRLAADMLETMYAAPGRGLAGPQVGAMLRIFVMDATWREGIRDPRVCLNPVLEDMSAETAVGQEGCLSIPGVLADVRRPVRTVLRWTDLEGRACRADLEGFAARCAQHEIDHLDGIVTFDRIAPEARARLLAEYAA